MTRRRAIDIAIATLCCASLAFCVWSLIAWRQIHARDAAIARFANQQDEAVPLHAVPELHAARGLMLLRQGRVDEAQAELDAIGADASSPARTSLLYALANAHLRSALTLFDSEPMRKVAPLIGLAQSEYRQVLRADPDNWDARYNFDLASSLTHDPGAAAYLQGDDMARERALVPDAPGAPNGLP